MKSTLTVFPYPKAIRGVIAIAKYLLIFIIIYAIIFNKRIITHDWRR